MNMEGTVSKPIAAAIINSLRGGVVPRIGLEYITVGRRDEINALLNDVEIIEQGGATFRFIVGKYGSGKTFLMHALRNCVCERGFVVSDVEISNERRFAGNKGQGVATYRCLMENLATQSKPDSGALQLILEKWISRIQNQVVQTEGITPQQNEFAMKVGQKIFDVATRMSEQVNGFVFGKILFLYYQAYITANEERKQNVLKWLRGEYKTKTEAKNDLGVDLIVTDENWYDFLKLFAVFVVQAGFRGLYLCFDELANIYSIPSKIGRDYNYKKILSIYNDILQGNARYLGIMMSNTPVCMEDEERGIYSLSALKTRIQDSVFMKQNLKDMTAPIIHIKALNPGELYVLVEKLTMIHAGLYEYEPVLGHDEFIYYLRAEYGRMQSAEEGTVREIIRNYITLLNLKYQHPKKTIEEILLLQNQEEQEIPLEEYGDYDRTKQDYKVQS